MSRCFPYPPPGYCGKRANNEALIESIKLQRERELAKAEKKKQKKEKKEKKEKKRLKKEKKKDDKEKAKENPDVGHDNKAFEGLKTCLDSAKGYENRRNYGSDQLERSDLTEEHGQPISLHQPSYSSDSTQNSKKRKRNAPPSPNGTSSHGNIFKIRLPLQKHKEPDFGNEHLCSTSGRAEPLSSLGPVADLPAVDISDEKPFTSTSGTDEVVAEVATRAPSSSFERRMQRRNSKYEDLTRNWVSPALQSELCGFDDQDWLFGQKTQGDRLGEKRYKTSGDASSCASSALWPPRAQYLSEVDLYALPFTVPF